MNDTDNIKKTFAKNLRFYMDDFGMNQSDVSKVAGVSKQSVSYWLNEKLLPRMGVIEKLADHFHILKSDLLEEKKSLELVRKDDFIISLDSDKIKSDCKKIDQYETSDLIKLGVYEDFKNDPFKYYKLFNEITEKLELYEKDLNGLALFLKNLKLPKSDFTYEVKLCQNLIHEISFIPSKVEMLKNKLEDLAEESKSALIDTPQKKRDYLELMHKEYVYENKSDEEINTIYQFLREQELNNIRNFKDTVSKKQDD